MGNNNTPTNQNAPSAGAGGGATSNADKIREVRLEEYKAIRAEIIQLMTFRLQVMTFGSAFAGAFLVFIYSVLGQAQLPIAKATLPAKSPLASVDAGSLFLILSWVLISFGAMQVHVDRNMKLASAYIKTLLTDKLELGSDGMPPSHWDNFKKNNRENIYPKPIRWAWKLFYFFEFILTPSGLFVVTSFLTLRYLAFDLQANSYVFKGVAGQAAFGAAVCYWIWLLISALSARYVEIPDGNNAASTKPDSPKTDDGVVSTTKSEQESPSTDKAKA